MIDWKGKRVLVCGGCGFIGSHLAKELVNREAKVVVVDNLSSGSRANIKDIASSVEFIEADLTNIQSAISVVNKLNKSSIPFAIFQLAADMGGIGYITSIGADIMRHSAMINLNMLEIASEFNVPHYFYSSSACIYPEYRQEETEVIPLKEEHAYPAMPDQFYGWEKLFTEKLCEAYQKDYKMNIRVGRFHNIFGPCYTSFDAQKGKAPGHMIIKAIKHPKPDFVIWGDGEQTRSFLYIDDCVEAILRLMDTEFSSPINIGSDYLVNMNYLAEIAIKLSGKEITPEHDLGMPQGVRGRNADLTLVSEVLNWKPKVSLEEGMKRTYEWAVKNYNRLENI